MVYANNRFTALWILASTVLAGVTGCDVEPATSREQIELPGGDPVLDESPGGSYCRGCITDFRVVEPSPGVFNLELCADLSVKRVESIATLPGTAGSGAWFTGVQWSLWDSGDLDNVCTDCVYSVENAVLEDRALIEIQDIDPALVNSLHRMDMVLGAGLPAYPQNLRDFPSVSIADAPGWACADPATGGKSPADIDAVGDQEIQPGDSIAAASAHITYDWPYGGVRSCSGVLVSPQHVLTAAHCFHQDVSAKDLRVSVGTREPVLQTTDKTMTPQALHLHPSWDRAKPAQTFDLALVELPGPSDIDPAPLAGFDPLTECDADASAYGFGVGRLGASPFDWGLLRKVGLAPQPELCVDPDKEHCVDPATHLAYVPPNGLDADTHGLCHGDSGGPVVAVCDGQLHVVGVTAARVLGLADGESEPTTDILEPLGASFAFSQHNVCGRDDAVGFVATRIDPAPVKEWIAGITAAPYAIELPNVKK